jgi:hypothetical protein
MLRSRNRKGVLMPDFLQEKQREITARLAELAPLVEEYERLQAADAALSATSAPSRTTRRQSTRARRGPGRPRGSGSRAAVTAATPRAKRTPRAGQGRRGRPKGDGKRATEALTHITSQPGITIPELARKMGINQSYLYKVLPTLEQAGSVTKQGRGWHPKGK